MSRFYGESLLCVNKKGTAANVSEFSPTECHSEPLGIEIPRGSDIVV